MGQRISRWRGAVTFSLGRDQRLFRLDIMRGGSRWRGLRARVLARPSLSIGCARPGLVVRHFIEHGAGTNFVKRPSFFDRLGIIHHLLLFLDNTRQRPRGGAQSGMVIFGGIPCRNGLLVCLFWNTGGSDWKLGTRSDAGTNDAGAVILAGAGWIWCQSRVVSLARLVAISPCECSQPCFGDPVGSGDQDGSLRSGAFQRLAAIAVSRSLGADSPGRGQRSARHRLRFRTDRSKMSARVLFGGKHRDYSGRTRRGVVGKITGAPGVVEARHRRRAAAYVESRRV